MKYICEKCNKSFSKKSAYIDHINKKISCIQEEKDKYKLMKKTCQKCNKIFSSAAAMRNHLVICKVKPSENDELKQIIIDLKNEMNEKLSKIENKPTTINNNNTITNNNTINIQQNIILPYGKEELDHITEGDYKRIFNKGCYAVSELIKTVYCNKNKPQNMNVFIKNLANDYLFVYNGQEWDVKEKDDVIHNMIETKKYLLECKYEDEIENLSKYEKYMFEKYLDKSEKDEVKNNIKKEVKMILYNNRNSVPKLKKNKISKPTKIKKPQTMKMVIYDD